MDSSAPAGLQNAKEFRAKKIHLLEKLRIRWIVAKVIQAWAVFVLSAERDRCNDLVNAILWPFLRL
jgi:hypothetical protein